MNYQDKKENFTQMSKDNYNRIFIDDNEWKVPVKLSKKVEDKIIYLTRRFFSVEWSGLLFYSITGKIEDGTLEIVAEDILTMDVGSAAHTAFKLDDRFMDYMMENPEAVEMKYGLIHSHNNMSVFFSGEDLSELEDNTPNHNFYLSVIVNNKLEIIGKLATQVDFKDKLVGQDVKALNAEGKPYVVFQKDFDVTYKKILCRDCEISFSQEVYSFEKDFEQKIDVLEEFCKPKPSTNFSPSGNYDFTKGSEFFEKKDNVTSKIAKNPEELKAIIIEGFCEFFEPNGATLAKTLTQRLCNVIVAENSHPYITQDFVEEYLFTLPSNITPFHARSVLAKEIKIHRDKEKAKILKARLNKVYKFLI